LQEALAQASALRQDAFFQRAEALQNELPEGEEALWRWLGLLAAEGRDIVAPAPLAIA
jgi:hypothetical protein